MALTFFQDSKEKQLFLIVWFVVLVISLAFIVWYFFGRQEDFTSGTISQPIFQELSVPEVNLKFLESPNLEDLILFENAGLPETFGRVNPFEPY